MLVVLAAGTAVAASPPPRFGGVQGKISKLSLTSITIKTSSSTVTDKLTHSTVVSTLTRGSLSDLKTGTFVRLTLASNKDVSTVNIGGGFGGFPRGTFPRPRRIPTANRPRRPSGLFTGGQIVSLKSGKISVRSFRGTTQIYALAKKVTVTKSVRGSIKNLRLGETVRVSAAPGSKTAFAITIVSS
jgi:hypothetical protein